MNTEMQHFHSMLNRLDIIFAISDLMQNYTLNSRAAAEANIDGEFGLENFTLMNHTYVTSAAAFLFLA